MENKAYVEIQGIQKFYPHKDGKLIRKSGEEKPVVKAVDGVNLSIQRGEILGVIGASGCGKSTLGRILVRLEDPTSGDVLIDGVSTRDMLKQDHKKFRRQVQIVFQNPFDTFTPRDTIQKILLRPLKHHNIGANTEERLEIIRKALEAGGLRPAEDIMSRYPHELSGGQLQRISIIRAMFLEPGFINADEPVSMRDVSVRAEIINMLIDLARNHNASYGSSFQVHFDIADKPQAPAVINVYNFLILQFIRTKHTLSSLSVVVQYMLYINKKDLPQGKVFCQY